VKKYALEQNSFVSVLYNKLMDESHARESSLSAKSNIQPSFVPSIATSLNHSNMSSNVFNNTQPNPFSVHLEKSRDPGTIAGNHHMYYGSYN
jgi:hypothetical protein